MNNKTKISGPGMTMADSIATLNKVIFKVFKYSKKGCIEFKHVEEVLFFVSWLRGGCWI
jgi:hypothetical protein